MDNADLTFGDETTLCGSTGAALGHIDQYELVRELGGGGFGCVYLARDTVAGIEVAVKGLPPEVKHNKEELENIRENFALVSRLHHPNIAAALVLHPVQGTFYATKDAMEKLRVFEGDTLQVMEYAPGETLSRWCKRFPDMRVPLETALVIVRQISVALDYAHERRIIHRDVKPANVVVGTESNGKMAVRVLDFGLAAEIRTAVARVSREVCDTSGTRTYMAPEQWAGEKQGPATDQYALAVLFCELATGEVPFAAVFGTGNTELMRQAVRNDEPKLPDWLSVGVRSVLAKALAKRGEDRFESCVAFADALQAALSGEDDKKWILIVGALLSFAALAVGLRYWLHPSPESQPELSSAVSNMVPVTNLPIVITADGNAAPVAVESAPDARAVSVRQPEAEHEALKLSVEVSEESASPKRLCVKVHGDEMTVVMTNGVAVSLACCKIHGGKVWVGRTEVTQEQWMALMGENPSSWQGRSNPVEQVSLADCRKFCNELSGNDAGWLFRLPTSDEWTSACHAHVGEDYHWGTSPCDDEGRPRGNFLVMDGDPVRGTVAVGSYEPNAFGLYDMHGNVAEWCGDGKVCGGSYDSKMSDCTVASILKADDTGARRKRIGFRIVAIERQNERAEAKRKE